MDTDGEGNIRKFSFISYWNTYLNMFLFLINTSISRCSLHFFSIATLPLTLFFLLKQHHILMLLLLIYLLIGKKKKMQTTSRFGGALTKKKILMEEFRYKKNDKNSPTVFSLLKQLPNLSLGPPPYLGVFRLCSCSYPNS